MCSTWKNWEDACECQTPEEISIPKCSVFLALVTWTTSALMERDTWLPQSHVMHLCGNRFKIHDWVSLWRNLLLLTSSQPGVVKHGSAPSSTYDSESMDPDSNGYRGDDRKTEHVNDISCSSLLKGFLFIDSFRNQYKWIWLQFYIFLFSLSKVQMVKRQDVEWQKCKSINCHH